MNTSDTLSATPSPETSALPTATNDAAALPVGVTLMTYNIGNGLATADRLADLLRAAAVDIVGLQEVAASQAGVLEQVRDVYPHQVVRGEGIPGKAILSRHPIIDSEPLDYYPGRPDLRATLRIGDRRLTVIVAHPLPPRIHTTGVHFKVGTREQITRLRELASRSGASVLMGDFNMTDHNVHYGLLTASGLVDAFRAVGKGTGYTLPMRVAGVRMLPFLRFDYVWHSPDFRTMDAWVGADAGSDHLPVLAQLAWRDSS